MQLIMAGPDQIAEGIALAAGVKRLATLDPAISELGCESEYSVSLARSSKARFILDDSLADVKGVGL